METIDIKRMADELNIYTLLLLLSVCVLSVAYYVSLLLVMVIILNRVSSLLCFCNYQVLF